MLVGIRRPSSQAADRGPGTADRQLNLRVGSWELEIGSYLLHGPASRIWRTLSRNARAQALAVRLS